MRTGVTLLLAGAALSASACAAEPKDVASAPAPEKQAMVPQAALDAYIELRRQRRADLWRAFPAEQGAIVFAGSSIIEEGPFQEMFPGRTVINRGIGADTTVGLADRLDELIALKPSGIFLYIGGNDRSRLDDTPEAAFARLAAITERLRAELPAAPVYVHTLFPREPAHSEWIRDFNDRIRGLSGNAMVFIVDVYPLALGENGAIDPALTNDGVHLLPEVYRRWQALLEQGPLEPGSPNK